MTRDEFIQASDIASGILESLKYADVDPDVGTQALCLALAGLVTALPDDEIAVAVASATANLSIAISAALGNSPVDLNAQFRKDREN